MSRSKQNYDNLVKKDGTYALNFDNFGRIRTAISPEVLSEGPEGPEGLQGPQGEKGEQGIKGDTTSAYHAKDAVANAAALPTENNEAGDVRLATDTQEFYVWGGSSWTNAGSIVPVKGDQGLTGDKGDKGEVGPEGAKGVRGFDGVQGIKGETGSLGAQGIQGEKGQKGNDVNQSNFFNKGETDALYAKKAGDTLTGRLDIDLPDEADVGMRLRGAFAMKMKGESIGGQNLFYSSSSDNSVSYEGVTTTNSHIVNKKYVDDVLAAQVPDLSGYYSSSQSDDLFVKLAGGLMTGKLTINSPEYVGMVTDQSIYVGGDVRLSDGGCISRDAKKKIKITSEGVIIVDVSAENSSKTRGLTLEGYTANGNGNLLRAHHPTSGYDSIYYYGRIDEGFHLTNKGYVDNAISTSIADYVTQAQVNSSLADYATKDDLDAAAPVGNEILPPVVVNDLTFAVDGGTTGGGPTSTSSGPPTGQLYGYNGTTVNKFLGNWTSIKIHEDSFLEPPATNTTEANENRIFEFYDKSNNVLAYKFVAKSVTKYGNWWLIERRFKMIAVGQGTGQITRGVLF